MSYSLDNEQQFWDGKCLPTTSIFASLFKDITSSNLYPEVDDIISTPCRTNESIDNTLRRYLSFTSNFSGTLFGGVEDIAGN